MAHLVPVYNDSPGLDSLRQDLQSYGIVIIHSICAVQRQRFKAMANALQSDYALQKKTSRSQQLSHYIRQGNPECGYGQLDCYVDPAFIAYEPALIHRLILAASQQWCTVGKPSRHLAVLVPPLETTSTQTLKDPLVTVSTPKQLKRRQAQAVARATPIVV